MSFYRTLRERWSNPSRTAIRTGAEDVSYAQLHQRVRRAAGWLRMQGIGPGDVVALQLPRTPALLELHLGALSLGAATLPLNDRYTPRELKFYLDDSGARLACLLDANAAALEGEVAARLVGSSGLRGPMDGAPTCDTEAALDGRTRACILYTSGTTGRPKGAMITHDNLAATVRALHQAWHWSERDVLVHALPLFHVHGLFVAQHGALFAGATSVWMERFEPDEAMRLMEREGTVFMGVPTFYSRFLGLDDRHTYDLSHVRLFTSGSAALPARVHEAFERRFGHRILERYGMTEVGIVLSNPYEGERRPGAVGFPLPGVHARITDPRTGVPLGPGDVGEIRISGPSVMEGYLGLPAQTEAAIGDGWMHTGDLGFVDEDGYFHVSGRARDLVISGGLNVYPAEVEAVLLEHPAVEQVAVVGLEDADLGERVVARVVLTEDIDPGTLVAHCREALAPYKCPKTIQRVDALPRNAMGKVQKARIRATFDAPTTVRDATHDDLDRIVAWNGLMAEETEGLVLDPLVLARGARAVLDGGVGARYLVAERGGEVVGQCMLTTEWSDWRNAPVWWLQSVYVPPEARRLGVFSSLYGAIVERASAQGVAGLRLYVDRRNARAAGVYERLGMNGEHYALYEHMFDDTVAGVDNSPPEEG